MIKLFLQLAILFAYFGICGIGKSQLPLSAVWCDTLQYKCVFVLFAGPFVKLLQVPPPEVVQPDGSTLSVVCQAASTDPSLEIEWYQLTTEGLKLRVENFHGLHFNIKSAVRLRTSILTIVTSTLTIEGLSVAYAGGYACRVVAGDIQVDSDTFQVQVSGRATNYEQV